MGLRARGRHYTQRWSSITELGLSTAPPEGGSENLCHFHNVLSCSEITQQHPAWEGNIIPPPLLVATSTKEQPNSLKPHPLLHACRRTRPRHSWGVFLWVTVLGLHFHWVCNLRD